MPKLILTDESVQSLKANGKPVDYTDSGEGVPFSFGVRVGARSKRWWTRYTLFGVRRRYFLGDFPQVKRDTALWEAFDIHQKVRQGVDPQVERQSRRNAKTVEQVVEVYLKEIDGVLSPKTCESYVSAIQREILPTWGKRSLDGLSRSEIRAKLREIKDRGAGSRTHFVLTVLSNLYKLSEIEGWSEGNPCIGIPRVWKAGRRTDFFTAEEIHRIWTRMSIQRSIVADCWLVLLLTGQRPGEVQQMRYDEIDGPWWEFHKTKNGRPQLVYLADATLDVIRELKKDRPKDNQYVFRGQLEGRPFCDWGKFGRGVRQRIGIPHMRPHTARHTFVTWLCSQDVEMHMVKTLVNHTWNNDVTAGYNHYRYRPQRQKWFTRYAEYIMSCARGEYAEVVDFQQASRTA